MTHHKRSPDRANPQDWSRCALERNIANEPKAGYIVALYRRFASLYEKVGAEVTRGIYFNFGAQADCLGRGRPRDTRRAIILLRARF